MQYRVYLKKDDPDSLHEGVQKAAQVLVRGGVILYPTDTVYGLGCDALNPAAIERISAIKGREEKKPMIMLVSDVEMAQRYAVWNDTVQALAGAFWPGPLTIELEHVSALPDILSAGRGKGGMRVPDHHFCRQLVAALGRPITSTSANPAGQPTALTPDAILASLGNAASDIDLIIEDSPDRTHPSLPSTLVSVQDGRVHVIRQGAISETDIASRGFIVV